MADRIKGITIEIGGDTTGLSKALSGINKEIRDTQSQLKDVERLLKLDPGNTELLAQKQRLLKESIEKTKDKLEVLKEAQEQVQKQFETGEIGVEQYEGLQREIIATKERLEELESQAKESNTALQEISALGGKISEAGQGVEEVGEKLLPLSATVTALGTASAVAAASFEEAMSKVKAISGATEEEMEQLNQKAIEMGAATKFSAKESADAFTYMAMAGWDAQQMIDGIGGIMSLAAADGLDLATTSDIVTDALTAFGLKASDSAHFADVLAQASSSANTNVSMLGESFKYVAPIAGTLGYSAEDTAIALGIMANAGIKGSQAGTTLKNALANMASPSKNMVSVMTDFDLSLTNADGSMKTLSEVLDMLRNNMAVTTKEQADANYALYEQEILAHAAAVGNRSLAIELSTMSESQRILTLEYMKGCDILESLTEEQLKKLAKDELDIKLTKDRVLTMEEYDHLARTLGQDTLNGVTEAEQAAAAAMLFGKEAMAGMLNVINATEADYNKLSDAIYGCEGRADSMAETMMDNTSGAIEQMNGAIETLAIMVGDKLSPAIRAVAEFVASLAEKASGMSDITMTLIVVIGAIVAALGPLLILIGNVLQSVGTIMSFAPQLGAAIGTVKTAILGLSGPIGVVIAIIASLVAGFGVLYATNEEFRDKVNAVWTKIKDNLSKIAKQLLSILESFKSLALELWDSYGDEITAITDAVFSTIAAVIETTMNLINDILAIALAVISGDWNAAIDGIVTLIKNFGENAKNIFSGLMDTLESIVMLAAWVISDLWDAFMGKILEIARAIVESLKERFTKMKDDAVLIFTNMKDGIAENVQNVKETIIEGISEAIDWIRSLPDKAITWGKDMMDGFADGIRSKISKVTSAVSDVAEGITEYIHFSRPDKGPLRNYEEWMPDMMSGLAAGIRDNVWLIMEQLEALTGNMSLSFNGAVDMAPASVVVRNYNQTIVDGKLIAESVDERLGELL